MRICLGIVLQGAGRCKSKRTVGYCLNVVRSLCCCLDIVCRVPDIVRANVRYCLNVVRSLCCCLDIVLSARTRGKVNSKGRKKGYDEYEITAY